MLGNEMRKTPSRGKSLGTRCEYIPVRSDAASMPRTVPSAFPRLEGFASLCNLTSNTMVIAGWPVMGPPARAGTSTTGRITGQDPASSISNVAKSNIQGSMLLEILITLALSLVVISAITTLMFNSLAQSRYQNEVFSLQRQWIRLSQLFMQEISTAGYRGCLKVDNLDVLQIQEAALIPSTWIGKGHVIKPKTMAIHLEKMSVEHDYLLRDHLEQENQWIVSTHQRLKTGDKILIASCEKSYLTTVLKSSLQKDQQVITTATTNQTFSKGAYLGLWQSKTVYIEKTGRINKKGEAIFGLYSYENGQTYEWAEGVNDLQVQRQSDAKSNRLLKVKILLSSLEPVTYRTQHYFFIGASHESQDGHLYQGMEVAIPLQPGIST